jgi:hypothetical protein
MRYDENEFALAMKSVKENEDRRAKERLDKIQESEAKKKEFIKNLYSIRESREARERNHSKLLESARNNALSTALKAIYIEALEPSTLTDNGIILAENMVDSWISEKGGAKKILSECSNKTYFLNRLTQIVEDAAEEEVKEIEKAEDDIEDDKKDDEPEDKKSEDDSKDKEEKSNDDKKEEETKDNSEGGEESKSDENPLKDPQFDDDEPEDSGDTQTDAADDIIDDMEVSDTDEPVSVDGEGEENNGKVFDELEKEEDVKKAIELIRQRVADAEETFIKRNAEDKKQIDELLAKISDNIKTVEDMDDEDSSESKVASEAARINKRKISNITENRALSVFEKMSRNLTSSITKDQSVREQYVTENGSLDIASVIESAKVMYGFLETINTLQLEKVNTNYISNVLENM